ncbi:MAG: M20/M25/M40 family metallo-hydrolase [Firmicutes bacterium]|nr:M20/M25/M40 family metallo-hydrolase [Bacillota bacterium]
MKWYTREGMNHLLSELTGIPSISGTKAEAEYMQYLYNILANLKYFRENAENLKLHPVKNDPLGRTFLTALVKGKIPSKKTVILLSHGDVVDVKDYGPYMDMAFKPFKLTESINPSSLPANAKKDYEEGTWLFGRGTMDMKAGTALQMGLIQQWIDTLDTREGNLLLLVVPDEESNSAGMISAAETLTDLAQKHDLEYLVGIDSEPQFPNYPGDDNNYIYVGSLGKIIALIYCAGKETHVGESLSGLNPNLLMSEVTRLIEINVDLSDEAEGEITPPPTSLKMKDLKELYSAQIPTSAAAYFNILTVSRSPKEIYKQIYELCVRAFENALERFTINKNRYIEMSGKEPSPIEWKPKVFSYKELYDMALQAHGSKFKNHMADFIENITRDPEMDERELNIQIIREVHKFCPDRDPMIIISFAPPYYPHLTIRKDKPKDNIVMEVAMDVIRKAREDFGEGLTLQKFFKGLSDMSYFALHDAEEVISYLQPNIPSWGIRYSIPVEAIKKLDLPVLNIGPYGKDAHKFTERLHLPYWHNVAPLLLKFAVEEILRRNN